MSTGFIITVFVILWIVGAINSVRKAVAKAQAASGGPDAVRAAIANNAALSENAARTAAAQRAARALRARMQGSVVQSVALPVQRAQQQPYLAPPADQAMTSLTSMEAPSMPTFDAPGLAVFSTGAQSASSAPGPGSAALAGRQFFLTEGANAGAATIIAAAIIGPPVGLRLGPQIASDW
jgi:hypothetical protein